MTVTQNISNEVYTYNIAGGGGGGQRKSSNQTGDTDLIANGTETLVGQQGEEAGGEMGQSQFRRHFSSCVTVFS